MSFIIKWLSQNKAQNAFYFYVVVMVSYISYSQHTQCSKKWASSIYLFTQIITRTKNQIYPKLLWVILLKISYSMLKILLLIILKNDWYTAIRTRTNLWYWKSAITSKITPFSWRYHTPSVPDWLIDDLIWSDLIDQFD